MPAEPLMPFEATPAVSVVMPTRNRASLLPRAIASVLDQTHANLELIVVDDASTDETHRVLDDYESRDARVRTIRLGARSGGAAARNHGIAATTARWVAFIDDDDEWHTSKLTDQLTRVQSPSTTGVVYCACTYIDESGREYSLPSRDLSRGDARAALLSRNAMCTSLVLVRRDVLDTVGGFDERLPRLQDWDLWIRLATVTAFVFVPKALVRVHSTSVSISTDPDALVEACRLLYQKYRSDNFSAIEMADFQHALGHILMIGGASAEAPPYLWRSVRGRPSLRRFVMAGLSSFGPSVYRTVSRTHERLVRLRTARTAAATRT